MTSAHAQSMGGSQVFLEEGEMQTVDTTDQNVLRWPAEMIRQ